MNVVFAGTPEFASLALKAILDAGYKVPLVLTQPDRRSGRGMRVNQSAVKSLALEHNIPVSQPRSLRLDGKFPDDAATAQQELLSVEPDVMVVAAYGLILPKWTLNLPKYGCLNIHASLLPRWRGAAPIQRAIEAGDSSTGITIMQMDEGLDTGDSLLTIKLPISNSHTAASLHDDLAKLGAKAIVQALEKLSDGTLKPTPQPHNGVTYAEKLSRAEAALDFSQPAKTLALRVRAFNPFPGATLQLPGIKGDVKVWDAIALEHSPQSSTQPYEVGEVIQVSQEGIDICTSNGVLRLLELQRTGGRRQPVQSFVQGWSR